MESNSYKNYNNNSRNNYKDNNEDYNCQKKSFYNELIEYSKSSKRDVHNHGIGVSSIQSIVKKYDGYVEFVDKGEKFEVDVSLYGMIS